MSRCATFTLMSGVPKRSVPSAAIRLQAQTVPQARGRPHEFPAPPRDSLHALTTYRGQGLLLQKMPRRHHN